MLYLALDVIAEADEDFYSLASHIITPDLRDLKVRTWKVDGKHKTCVLPGFQCLVASRLYVNGHRCDREGSRK